MLLVTFSEYCANFREISLTSLTRSLSRDNNEKKVLADSFRVPTVYRIGSLHLSEGVRSCRSDMSAMFGNVQNGEYTEIAF